MAAIIRIKRSTGTSAPGSLKTGELAYSAGTGLYNNGGDRLFFGKGDDGNGIATSVVAIGGEYFANLADHSPGTLTASSALVVDANSKIDVLNIDNVTINGNTISSTNTNGNIVLDPNGTGTVDVNTSKIVNVSNPTSAQDAATKAYVDAQNDSQLFTVNGDTGTDTIDLDDSDITFSGDDWISTAVTNNTVTISHDVSGVTAGTYGSQTQIPIFTVDNRGHIDSAGSIAVATTLNTAGDAGTGTVDLLTQTITAVGGTNINTISSGQSLIVHMDSDVLGLSSLTVDQLSLNGRDITSTDTNGNINITPNGSGEVVASTLTVSDLTDNRVVIAGTSGALEDDTNFTFDGSTLALTANQNVTGTLTVTGQANVDNLRLDGNTISTTDGSNTMVLDPSPVGNAGDLIIRGNLQVEGTTTTINSTVVSMNDLNLVLADSAANAAAADGAGITINGAAATILYDAGTDRWDFNKSIDLVDSDSLFLGGINIKEVMEDHLANNTFQEHNPTGQVITYDDGANTITFSNEYATLTNVGVASFGGYADGDSADASGTTRQFDINDSGNVFIRELDGGTY
jgi:hypothetical protein